MLGSVFSLPPCSSYICTASEVVGIKCACNRTAWFVSLIFSMGIHPSGPVNEKYSFLVCVCVEASTFTQNFLKYCYISRSQILLQLTMLFCYGYCSFNETQNAWLSEMKYHRSPGIWWWFQEFTKFSDPTLLTFMVNHNTAKLTMGSSISKISCSFIMESAFLRG